MVSKFEVNKTKSDMRIRINLTLLGVCFTLFTFLVAFNPSLLQENLYLTFQLVCAIPLLMTSVLSHSKSSYTPEVVRWKNFAFFTFLLAYAFLINVIGMFLILFISVFVGFAFFGLNIFLALVYSRLEISYQPSRTMERFFKDMIFLGIIILLGILPALGTY